MNSWNVFYIRQILFDSNWAFAVVVEVDEIGSLVSDNMSISIVEPEKRHNMKRLFSKTENIKAYSQIANSVLRLFVQIFSILRSLVAFLIESDHRR